MLVNDLKQTIKYPTSLIVRGADVIGIELAKSLLDQGGYVIIVDFPSDYTKQMISELSDYSLFTFIDFSKLPLLEDSLRRLDYVFYLNHKIENLEEEISSQEFLEFSKFLDLVLGLAKNFEAKFLATTSIKAHQYMFAKSDYEVNLDSKTEIHKVYTETEIQRYIESLTLEYIQKSTLDARIIRLGEIIGKDIEYNPDSTVGRIIKDGLVEDEITIYGDGLQSEYYVHIQDAVYGIIKAQFTKNTRGEIFSLCYEFEITSLSIAYKINEFIDPPKEIVFSSEEESEDIPLRLYTPAPNLMRIGWKPRVKFSRALKQTFEYVQKLLEFKEEMIEEQFEQRITEKHKKKKKQTGLKDFLRNIFFVPSESEANDSEFDDEQGALSRLIAERKVQENGRKGSILLATQELRKQNKRQFKKKRSITFKISNFITRKFDNFTKKFDLLRYITIKQFIFLLGMFVGVVFIYINVFAPVISFGRHMFVAYMIAEDIEENIKIGDYVEIQTYFENLSAEITAGNQKILSFRKVLKNWNLYAEFLENYNALYQGVKLLDEGISDSYYGTENTVKYVESFDPQIVYKPSGTSLLNVKNSENYSELISNIKSKSQIVGGGIEKINKGIQELEELNMSPVNENLGNKYQKFLSNIKTIRDKYELYYKISRIIPELVGTNQSRTYAFILVDTSYYLPAGGTPTSLVLITFKDGGIQEISTQVLTEQSFDLSNTDPILIEEINLVSSSLIDTSSLDFNKLFYLQQGDLYLDEISRLIYEQKGKTLNGIFIFDSSFLQELMKIVGTLEIKNITFDETNLIVNMDLLMQNTLSKKEVLNDITALSTQAVLNDLDTNIGQFSNIFQNAQNNKDVIYKFYNTDLTTTYESSDNLASVSQDFINIIAVADLDNYQGLEIPSIRSEVDVYIKDDLSSRKTVTVYLNDLRNLDTLSICLPNGVTNFSFREEDRANISESFGQLKTCIKFIDFESEKVSFSYDSPYIENSDYDYSLGLRKQPGLAMQYELVIRSEEGKIGDYTEGGFVNKNQVSYSDTLKTDKIFTVEIE
ncbi:DUF4012 domain-containing protein [Candidatus Dojkabacteria bacterium]|nr:DUF4012 domain-containing protein [Candidatus Dojkabacteria bacterium]